MTEFEKELNSLSAEIEVLNRRKIGVISEEYDTKEKEISTNYKMGLITFAEMLRQKSDLVDYITQQLKKEGL